MTWKIENLFPVRYGDCMTRKIVWEFIWKSILWGWYGLCLVESFFSELSSPQNTFQLHKNIFVLQLMSRTFHYTYSCAIQRITWKNCLGIVFLERLILVTSKNVFGINFAIIPGWSVYGQNVGEVSLNIDEPWAISLKLHMEGESKHHMNGRDLASEPLSWDSLALVEAPKSQRFPVT